MLMMVRNRNPRPIPPPAGFGDQKLISAERAHFNPTQAERSTRVKLAPAVIDLLAKIVLDDTNEREAQDHE